MKIVIDASEGVLGRVAGYAAKQALFGKEVVVVNCNDVMITGRKQNILEKYKRLIAKGGSSLKGPKITKTPERIVKRTIRGMLPHKQARGINALKKVMCYNVVPAEFEKADKIALKRELKTKGINLKELCREL